MQNCSNLNLKTLSSVMIFDTLILSIADDILSYILSQLTGSLLPDFITSAKQGAALATVHKSNA